MSDIKGNFKVDNSDFRVSEVLDVPFSGEGEHQWLFFEKDGQATMDVVKRLARVAEVPARDVGHSGLKDKNAVTRQWLSLRRGNKPNLEEDFLKEHLGITLLESHRHTRKLRVGTHSSNRFELIVRNLEGDQALLEHNLQEASSEGVPNFFGGQRFGVGNSNLERIERATKGQLRIKGRNQRSMLLSSARSWLFNQILTARVEQGCWNKLIDGDAPMFRDSETWIKADRVDEALLAKSDELMPTVLMPGKGDTVTAGKCFELEESVIKPWQHWVEWLTVMGVNQDRRGAVMLIRDLDYSFDIDVLKLSFELKRGSFATTLLECLGEFAEERRFSRN